MRIRTTKTSLTKTMVDRLGSPPVATITVQDDFFAMMQEEADVGWRRGTSSQEKQEALTKDAGFLLRVFPREWRYAELGYALQFSVAILSYFY
jgi:hypothetical protein